MTMRSTADFLREALAILERDAPVAAMRLWREVAGLTLRFEVGDEMFAVAAQGVFLAHGLTTVDIDVRCETATILTLIDGEARLMDCVLTGVMDIRGDVMVMPALSRASVGFTEGAVRSRAMRALLEEFRAQTNALNLKLPLDHVGDHLLQKPAIG